MSRSVLRGLIGIVVAVIFVLAAAGGFVWWKISGLKEELVRNLGQTLGAQVQVASVDFDLWKGELRAAGISLTNSRPSAPWEKGTIGQAVVRFHLQDVMAENMPLSVEVSNWSVVLQSITAPAPDAASASTPAETSVPARHKLKVTELSGHNGTVEVHLGGGQIVLIDGVTFGAGDNGAGIWTTQLQATSVTAGSLQAGASSVQIVGGPEKMTFSELRVACGEGMISGEGEVTLGGGHAAKVTLKATDVPVVMLVNAQWQMKLSGAVTGDVAYESTDTLASAKGQVSLGHGKFNFLPWLNQLTSLVGLPNMTDTEVDKATTDFTWKEHAFHLSNIDVRKNEVARIAGAVDIDPTGQVDGRLKLGLPSSITAKFPQIQQQVFPVALEDYNWAEVHVTGTPDHLQEDLSARLATAGVQEGVQEGTGLLNQAAQKASDLLKGFLGK